MLRLFRHIRQRLFLEGKVSRYLGYAIGEIVLIVVGIMIALEANEWKEERRERVEERIVLGRMIEELEKAIRVISAEGLYYTIEQRKSLEEVSAAFRGKSVQKPFDFLSEVAMGATAGWGQPDLPRTTYDELTGSGKISLIRNVELRGKIAEYYDLVRSFEKRSALRVNDYAKLAYDLVPRKSENLDWHSEDQVKEGLSEEAYGSLAQAVLESDLRQHVTAALNRTLLMEANWALIEKDAKKLIVEIEAELAN